MFQLNFLYVCIIILHVGIILAKYHPTICLLVVVESVVPSANKQEFDTTKTDEAEQK